MNLAFGYCERGNEWRDVADVASSADVSIVRFCQNVGIGEYILPAIPLFCENVGIDECFLLAMPSFCQNVGIE